MDALTIVQLSMKFFQYVITYMQIDEPGRFSLIDSSSKPSRPLPPLLPTNARPSPGVTSQTVRVKGAVNINKAAMEGGDDSMDTQVRLRRSKSLTQANLINNQGTQALKGPAPPRPLGKC